MKSKTERKIKYNELQKWIYINLTHTTLERGFLQIYGPMIIQIRLGISCKGNWLIRENVKGHVYFDFDHFQYENPYNALF